MRTTLHINDDAYKIVMRYAKIRKIGMGKAVSELVVRGAQPRVGIKEKNGLSIFDLPAGTPVVTTEQVKKIMEEEGI